MIFPLAAASSSNASSYSGMILIILMIVLMYFMMIRPQQKQRKQHDAMVNRMAPGDEVVTIGRLHGVIDSIDTTNKTVSVDCDGIYLTFDINAIASVKKPGDSQAKSPAATVDDKSKKDDSKAEAKSSDDAKADDKKDAKADSDDDKDADK